MIKVTRLDGSQFYVNAELIEFIEATPDTVLSLTSHRKIVVREPAAAVVEQVIAYKRRLACDAPGAESVVAGPAVG